MIRLNLNKMPHKFVNGEYAMCYYFRIPNDYAEGLELYFCKVLDNRGEYSVCEIYYGEELNPYHIKGVFKDVCTGDLIKLTPEEVEAALAVPKINLPSNGYVRHYNGDIEKVAGYYRDRELNFCFHKGDEIAIDNDDFMMMTKIEFKEIEKFLRPRYQVTKKFPTAKFEVGEILPEHNAFDPADFPDVFREMKWYENCMIHRMPKYICWNSFYLSVRKFAKVTDWVERDGGEVYAKYFPEYEAKEYPFEVSVLNVFPATQKEYENHVASLAKWNK